MSKISNNQTVIGSTIAGESKVISTNFAQEASDTEIERASKALEKNGFKVTVVENLDQAKTAVLKIIPKGSEVFTATSVTADKAGLTEELNSDKYLSVRDKFMPLYGQPEKAIEMKRIGSGSEYTVGSVHALTQDGHALIASATGSQLPNYVYGAKNVIWVVGSQKIVKDLAEGLDRIENHTFHLEDARAQKAYGAHSSLKKILIYRQENPGRVSIILVKEAIGF